MIASNKSKDLPLVVIVSEDSAPFANVQRRLSDRCLFFTCSSELAAARIARDELVSGWLIDATSETGMTLASRLAETSSGHRMALVDSNYRAETEIAAYQNGALYACGELAPEWVEGFLGYEDHQLQTFSEGTLVSS